MTSTEDTDSNNKIQAADSPIKLPHEDTLIVPSAKIEPEESAKVADTKSEHKTEEQNKSDVPEAVAPPASSSPAKEPEPERKTAAKEDEVDVAKALDKGADQVHTSSFLDKSHTDEIQEHDFDSMFDSLDANPNHDMTFDDMDFTLTGTDNSNNSFGDMPSDLNMSVMGTQGGNDDLGALLDYPQGADDFMIVDMPAGNEPGGSSIVDDLFGISNDNDNNNIDLTVESSFEDLFGVGYGSADGSNGGMESNTHDGEFDNKFFGLPDE